jgi:cysteine synthase
MVAAIKGYRMILVMPEHQSLERRQSMHAFGAELVLTPKAGGMETARDTAERMRAEGQGIILDQFANPDNPLAHYRGTGPEIWRDTNGTVTHFVSAMGTTGTIMGVSRFLKEQNVAIAIIETGGKAQIRYSQVSRPICRRSTTKRVSIARIRLAAGRRDHDPAPRCGGGSSAVSRRAVRAKWRCIANEVETPPSCSAFVTAETGICRPVFFRGEIR